MELELPIIHTELNKKLINVKSNDIISVNVRQNMCKANGRHLFLFTLNDTI